MFYHDLYSHYTCSFSYGPANHQYKAVGLILQCGCEGVHNQLSNHSKFLVCEEDCWQHALWHWLLATCFVASPAVLSSLFITQQCHLNISRLLQWTWSTHVPKSLPFLPLDVGPCHLLYNGYNRLTCSQCYELCFCTSTQLCSLAYANCKALEEYLFHVQLGQLIRVAL